MHFILDSIPHFDTTDDGKFTLRQNVLILLDILIGVVLFVIFYDKISHPVAFISGAFGCLLPDILDVAPFWKKNFQKTWFGDKMHYVHDKIQAIKIGPFLGLSIQAIFIAFSVLILILK
ncbi:MAG: hypothetical protein WC080_01480 [Patescibacteria group bacterium]